MTDDVEAIIRDMRAGLDREFEAAAARLRAAAAAAAAPTSKLRRPAFTSVKRAAHEVGMSESHLRKLCRKHTIDKPGGFAMVSGGRIRVDLERLRAFMANYPRRLRRQ